MTLRPTDMLEIQTAIDEYERKFPRRPAPTAEVALAWRLGKREWARRQAAKRAGEHAPEPESTSEEKPDAVFAQQECNRIVWAWEQVRLRWDTWRVGESVSQSTAETLPWVKGVLRVGWWGVVAVVVVSIFFFGAIIGGFK